MELKEIFERANEHAQGDNTNLGTRTIARWIAEIAAALTKPAITAQPYGYIEGSGNIRYVEAHGGPGYLAQQLDQSRVRKLEAALAEEQKRHKVTQEQLDKFQSACADQTIQIMELRLAVTNLRDAEGAAVAREQAKAERARVDACQQMDRVNERYAVQLNRAQEVEMQRERCDRRILELEAAFRKLQGHIVDGDKLPGVMALADAAIEHINAPCEDCKALAAQLDAVTPAAEPTAFADIGSANDIDF